MKVIVLGAGGMGRYAARTAVDFDFSSSPASALYFARYQHIESDSYFIGNASLAHPFAPTSSWDITRQDIALIRSRALARHPSVHFTDDRRFLRWFVRLLALLLLGELQRTLNLKRNEQKWWQGDADIKVTQSLLDECIELYVNFAILEDRIEGNLPAFEGIRIVRERVREDE